MNSPDRDHSTSAAGPIHLLLFGDDSLWLFAALAPTIVPEPATMTLFLMSMASLTLRHR